MSNRDLSRRLLRLETDRHSHGFRYEVSDRLLSDADWRADMDGGAPPDVGALQPIMTIKEWQAEFCTGGQIAERQSHRDFRMPR